MVNPRLTTIFEGCDQSARRSASYRRKKNHDPDYDCQFTIAAPHADLILQS